MTSGKGGEQAMLDAFLSLLAGEIPGQIVWTADITYWIAGRKQQGVADPAWDTEEGYLRLHRDLGLFPYYYYEKFWVAEARYDARIDADERRDGDRTLRRFRTPLGEIVEATTYSPSSCSTACTRHFVNSESDLDVLLCLLEHRRLEPANLLDYPERRRLWAEYGGLPCLGMPRSPLAALCTEWIGMQNLAYLLADCPDKVRLAMEMMEAQETPILDAVCELAPPLVHFPDNLSSENLAGLYDAWMAGTHRRRIERLRAAGVRCAVHLDGTVRGLLPKLAAAGFKAVEAITPKPAGDLEVEAIRGIAGRDDTVLWGGVPGVMFSPPFSWETMEAHVRRVLECWAGQPFVLGVADQVPPDGDIGFCHKIAALVHGCTSTNPRPPVAGDTASPHEDSPWKNSTKDSTSR